MVSEAYVKKRREDEELIHALCSLEEGLSESELRFVDDVARQMKANPDMTLTPRQWAWASDIAKREGV